MTIEFASAALGGAIGLLGGLGGVALGHALTERREIRSRTIAGLNDVVRELEKRRRLSLDIAQHVNMYAAEASKDEAKSIFDRPGWKDVTLALYERTWVFPCIAYLPTAKGDFERLDDLISLTMGKLDDGFDERKYETSIAEIHRTVKKILVAVEARLAALG
jgi:hypothetical protein